MRHGLVRHKPDRLFQFQDGFFVIACILVDDAEIEPGVRNSGVLLLRLQELRAALLRLPRAQERQTVVDAIHHRIRRKLERGLFLIGSLNVRVRVFVERFAQVSVFPKLLIGGWRAGLCGHCDIQGRNYPEACETSHLRDGNHYFKSSGGEGSLI